MVRPSGRIGNLAMFLGFALGDENLFETRSTVPDVPEKEAAKRFLRVLSQASKEP